MYDTTKPYKAQIRELIQQTWDTPYVFVSQNDSPYPIVNRKTPYVTVPHTDGTGTKGTYHWQQRTFKNAALDAFRMNENDLLLAGARMFTLQNHIYLPEDDKEAIIEIIESIVEECKKKEVAVTGGETSIHDTMEGLEISMSVLGFRAGHTANRFQPGDVLVGLKSNGLHANGFTKVREVFGDEYRDEFVIPTRSYADAVRMWEEQVDIHGMMHITGGAYTKLKDLLRDADAVIRRDHALHPQPIFEELCAKGISDEEMYKTFNCGIGFVLSASRDDAEEMAELDDADIIGEVIQGDGNVIVQSAFSDKEVIY